MMAADVRPEIGMKVCDCWYTHTVITRVHRDGDTVRLDNGMSCSFRHCCDPVDHTWEHPAHHAWPPGWHDQCAAQRGRP